MKYLLIIPIATLFTLATLTSYTFAMRPIAADQLVKCPDFSTVYYLTADNERWVFPDETTYFTWFIDNNDIIEVSCEELSSFPLAGVVPYQPGTKLLTMQSTNDVYAVEPGGILRLIESEEDAIERYGDNWKYRVRDLPEGFWPAYTLGEPLATGEYAIGTTFWDRNDEDPPASLNYYFDGTQLRAAESLIDSGMEAWSAQEIDLDTPPYPIGDPLTQEEWIEIKTIGR